jgi:hypothetical protein
MDIRPVDVFRWAYAGATSMVAITLAVAALSLTVSTVTAWLTLFRRGTVKMTHPTQVFFGPWDARHPGEHPLPKIYLRTLLFATAKRGRVIENMYVVLIRDDAVRHHFNIWVYGERHQLVRGSGLFVGEAGIAANHHFLSAPDRSEFSFLSGRSESSCDFLAITETKNCSPRNLISPRDRGLA